MFIMAVQIEAYPVSGDLLDVTCSTCGGTLCVGHNHWKAMGALIAFVASHRVNCPGAVSTA